MVDHMDLPTPTPTHPTPQKCLRLKIDGNPFMCMWDFFFKFVHSREISHYENA